MPASVSWVRRRLHTMDVATAIGGDEVEIGVVDPGAVAFEDDQLGAAGENSGAPHSSFLTWLSQW